MFYSAVFNSAVFNSAVFYSAIYKMDGLNILLCIVFLLIITFIGLVRAESLGGVFVCFILLTIISYITIYMFNA